MFDFDHWATKCRGGGKKATRNKNLHQTRQRQKHPNGPASEVKPRQGYRQRKRIRNGTPRGYCAYSGSCVCCRCGWFLKQKNRMWCYGKTEGKSSFKKGGSVQPITVNNSAKKSVNHKSFLRRASWAGKPNLADKRRRLKYKRDGQLNITKNSNCCTFSIPQKKFEYNKQEPGQQYGGKHTNNQQTGQRCTGSRRKTMSRGKERGVRLEGCSLPRNKVSRSTASSPSAHNRCF